MSNTIKAAYWMIGTMFSFIMMAISGRELGGDLDTFEIMTYRSLIGIMIVIFFIIYNKSYFEINIKRLKLHFIRNIFHFTGQNLWFFAVIYIPLSQVFAFEFTVPIWVAVLAPIFLKEKLTFVRLLTVFIGFVGILIIARPNFSSKLIKRIISNSNKFHAVIPILKIQDALKEKRNNYQRWFLCVLKKYKRSLQIYQISLGHFSNDLSKKNIFCSVRKF